MIIARLLRYLMPAVAAGISLFPTGCHKTEPVAPVIVKAKPVPQMMPVDLKTVRPNECGDIPILEYHALSKTTKFADYEYPAASFRKDLEWLYAHKYRPISLTDYINGIVDCPAGTTPVVLTFDDSVRSQFNYLPNGKIDPDCAVGILDAFHAKHPDWQLKGTFFVLTNGDPRLPAPFYQPDSATTKMQYLISDGFEVGNHTVHHLLGMSRWPDSRVEYEFAHAVVDIHRFLPNYTVDTLALPFGVYPRNKKLVISGASGALTYHNICALKAGAEPAPSPISKKFNPYRVARMIPCNGHTPPGGYATIAYWLARLQENAVPRFISDGDPRTYTVLAKDRNKINMARLKKSGFFLRLYDPHKFAPVKS